MGGIRKDLSGQKFGKLTVLEFGYAKKGYNYWKCECECGRHTYTTTGGLNSGNSKSCGCANRLKKGVSGFNSLLYRYKRAAKLRNLKFLLTKNQFKKLTSSNCFYCNIYPTNIIYASGSNNPKKSLENGNTMAGVENSKYIYNGIDRIDSNIGYIKQNVVSCCGVCNHMKLNSSKEEFLNKVKQIYTYLKLDTYKGE